MMKKFAALSTALARQEQELARHPLRQAACVSFGGQPVRIGWPTLESCSPPPPHISQKHQVAPQVAP
jgi:hypothetical protein